VKQHQGLFSAIADTIRAYNKTRASHGAAATPQMVLLGNQEKLILGFVVSDPQ
jgi:hypothetical protein